MEKVRHGASLRMTGKGILFLIMFSLSGVAAAQSSATVTPPIPPSPSEKVKEAQPNVNPGLVAGLLSANGLTTANTISASVNTFAAAGGGAFVPFSGFNPGTQRFALPKQGETGAAAESRPWVLITGCWASPRRCWRKAAR